MDEEIYDPVRQEFMDIFGAYRAGNKRGKWGRSGILWLFVAQWGLFGSSMITSSRYSPVGTKKTANSTRSCWSIGLSTRFHSLIRNWQIRRTMIGSSVKRLRIKLMRLWKTPLENLSLSCLPLRMILIMTGSLFPCPLSDFPSRLVEGSDLARSSNRYIKRITYGNTLFNVGISTWALSISIFGTEHDLSLAAST